MKKLTSKLFVLVFALLLLAGGKQASASDFCVYFVNVHWGIDGLDYYMMRQCSSGGVWETPTVLGVF